MAKPELNENQTAAATYILTFYQEIDMLTNQYAVYLNVLSEIDSKYKSEEDKTKIAEDEKENLKVTSQQIRYYATKTYIRYNTLKSTLKNKLEENKELPKLYEKIKDEFLVERAVVEKYIEALHKVLVQGIIQDLLQTSQEIVESVYKE